MAVVLNLVQYGGGDTIHPLEVQNQAHGQIVVIPSPKSSSVSYDLPKGAEGTQALTQVAIGQICPTLHE